MPGITSFTDLIAWKSADVVKGDFPAHRSGVKNQKKIVSWTEQVWENYERITGQKRPPLFETNHAAKTEKPQYDDSVPV